MFRCTSAFRPPREDGPDAKQVFAEARKFASRPLFAHIEPADRVAEIGGFDGC
jgi:hypothetical protein